MLAVVSVGDSVPSEGYVKIETGGVEGRRMESGAMGGGDNAYHDEGSEQTTSTGGDRAGELGVQGNRFRLATPSKLGALGCPPNATGHVAARLTGLNPSGPAWVASHSSI
jgi:hypothetical protein